MLVFLHDYYSPVELMMMVFTKSSSFYFVINQRSIMFQSTMLLLPFKISTDHLSPLVGEKRARFEYELDKYEVCISKTNRLFAT